MNLVTWLDDCRKACKDAKSLAEPFDWVQRGNRIGKDGWTAVASLLDKNGVAIPRLTVVFNYEARTYGQYQSYALMYAAPHCTYRVFMLEVCPKHKVAHTESGLTVRGPHLLLGDRRANGQGITRPCVRKASIHSHGVWLGVFRRHVEFDEQAYSLSTVSGPLFAQNAP